MTWSGSLTTVTRLHLNKKKIKADRTSPAFSAIEDATILKEMQFDFKFKKQTAPKVEKLNLTGTKISAHQNIQRKNLKLASSEKLDLLGEKIEVEHFTNKFVNSRPQQVLAKKFKQPKNGLGFESHWTPKSQGSKNLLSSSGQTSSSPEAQNLGVLKKVLPSGIVLSMPNLETAQEKRPEPNSKIETSTLKTGAMTTLASSTPNLGVNSINPVKINGEITLDGGTYLREKEFTYHIERHAGGNVFETDSIKGHKKNFQLEVLSPQGYISVELRAPEGEVLAYGETDLKELKNDAIAVSLQPTEGLFAGRVLDDQKSKGDSENGVALAKTYISGVAGSLPVDEDGYFGESSLFNLKSHFVSSTAKKDYWPTVTLSESGKALYPRLVKKSFIKQLSSSIDPYDEEIKIDSLLLGTVTHMGMRQSDMIVEIYGQEYQKPIYLSMSGRPDPALKKTTNNGGFLFSNLPDGGYLIQVKKDKAVMSQKWFIVKSGHISRGQIDLRAQPTKLALFKTFPENYDKERLLSVQEIGSDVFEEVSSVVAESSGVEIESKTKPALTAIKVRLKEDSDNDFDQLHMIPSRSEDQNLRLIDEQWLKTFLNHNRSNRNQSLGLVVGFIQDDNFKLITETSEALTQQSEIYYFDKNGDKTESGIAGGGFVVTNTKLGFQNLIVKLNSEDKFLNKIILTSSGSLSVF